MKVQERKLVNLMRKLWSLSLIAKVYWNIVEEFRYFNRIFRKPFEIHCLILVPHWIKLLGLVEQLGMMEQEKLLVDQILDFFIKILLNLLLYNSLRHARNPVLKNALDHNNQKFYLLREFLKLFVFSGLKK